MGKTTFLTVTCQSSSMTRAFSKITMRMTWFFWPDSRIRLTIWLTRLKWSPDGIRGVLYLISSSLSGTWRSKRPRKKEDQMRQLWRIRRKRRSRKRRNRARRMSRAQISCRVSLPLPQLEPMSFCKFWARKMRILTLIPREKVPTTLPQRRRSLSYRCSLAKLKMVPRMHCKNIRRHWLNPARKQGRNKPRLTLVTSPLMKFRWPYKMLKDQMMMGKTMSSNPMS